MDLLAPLTQNGRVDCDHRHTTHQWSTAHSCAGGSPPREHNGHGRRGWLMALIIAFDLLRLNGDDLRQRPLEARPRFIPVVDLVFGPCAALSSPLASPRSLSIHHAATLFIMARLPPAQATSGSAVNRPSTPAGTGQDAHCEGNRASRAKARPGLHKSRESKGPAR